MCILNFNFCFFFTDMVSYSNYKRHLKNAHPSINHEDFVTEEEGEQQPKYLGHQVDDDDLDQNNLVVDGDERGDQVEYTKQFRNKLENEQGCQIGGKDNQCHFQGFYGR